MNLVIELSRAGKFFLKSEARQLQTSTYIEVNTLWYNNRLETRFTKREMSGDDVLWIAATEGAMENEKRIRKLTELCYAHESSTTISNFVLISGNPKLLDHSDIECRAERMQLPSQVDFRAAMVARSRGSGSNKHLLAEGTLSNWSSLKLDSVSTLEAIATSD